MMLQTSHPRGSNNLWCLGFPQILSTRQMILLPLDVLQITWSRPRAAPQLTRWPGRKGLVVGLLHLIASEAHVAQQIVLAPLFKGGALCLMRWMCFKCVWNVDQTQRRYTRKIRAATNHCCPCRCDPAIPQLCAKTMPAWHTFSACVAARGADRPRSRVGHQIYSVPNHQTKHWFEPVKTWK